MGGGALAPLVTVGNAADLETQRCIAYALCNLAADTVHRAAIVNEGGLPPLISLACSDDANDMKAAVSTIRGLSASPDARRQIVVAGALEAPLVGSRLERRASSDVCAAAAGWIPAAAGRLPAAGGSAADERLPATAAAERVPAGARDGAGGRPAGAGAGGVPAGARDGAARSRAGRV